MRLVIQRVSEAQVSIEGNIVAKISKGLMVLCGICTTDSEDDVVWIAHKLLQMRIFRMKRVS